MTASWKNLRWHTAAGNENRWRGYAVVVIGILFAALARWALGQVIGHLDAFFTFYPVVFVAVIWGGTRVGLLTMIVTAVIGELCFLEPPGPSSQGGIWQAVEVLLYIILSLIVIFLFGQLRSESEALQSSEKRFRTMANAIPQLAWIARADGYLLWYNQRWYEYTGATPDEMQGWGWQSVHDPEVLPKVMEQWRHSIDTGEPFDMEFPLRGADGRFRPFLTRVMPLKDQEGKVAFWFGTNTDITDLREREVALARQARLIDLAPAATMVRQLDGTITFWSQGAERLYGWSSAEALGRRSHDLLGTEFPEPLETIVAKARDHGTWSGELRHRTRDGRKLVVQSYWLAGVNTKGDVEELFESNNDITELKRLQQNLEDAVEELEHMSYSMVHDMRAPLRAMRSYAQMMESECTKCPKRPVFDYLGRIGDSSARLDSLITDALNYSKVARHTILLEPVDLGRLLQGMIETYPNLQPPAVDIRVEVTNLSVLGNESLLTQCFGNLLDNAVKFVGPGIKPCIRVWAEPSTIHQKPAITIFVEDNGIGIPKAAQERMFRMFQRMHGEGDYPGTGIGLAIARKAVERMHGRISVESEPGKGCRFRVELPLPLISASVVE